MNVDANQYLPHLLRACAQGELAREWKHDIIFNTAADELEALRRVRRAADSLARELSGMMGSFERGMREGIGHTNYAVLDARRVQLLEVLKK